MNTVPPMLFVGYGLGALLYGGYWIHLLTRRRALAARLSRRAATT